MKKTVKSKKVYSFLFIFIFFVGGISIQGAMVSSTIQGYFGSKEIEETFTEEQNNELKEYLISKTEEVNQASTFYEDGSKIGKMKDYYGTDQRFKLNPAYVQAYVKYKKLTEKYTNNKDMDFVKKEISDAEEVLQPKFVYRNFEKITKRTIEETSTDAKTGASTTHTRVEVTKENIILIVHAENVEKTYNITYKMSTENFGDTTITKPMLDSITEEGNEYDNLKKAISKDFNGDEDINKAEDAIVTIAKQYIDDYSQSSIDGIGGGAGFIPLFIQWDSKWGNYPYSASNVAEAGCGPTSLAMVVTGLEGNIGSWDKNGDKIFTPDEAAAFSTANGGVDPGAGTIGDVLFPKAASTFGLNCRHYFKNEYDKVLQELNNGHPVIANVHGSESIPYGSPGSTFTQHGHFIVLVGVDENGKIRVNDPNNKLEQSSKSWDFLNIIVAESDNFWAFDNPNMKMDTFEATAYTSSASEGGTGSAFGISLEGKDLRNKLIAVDPNVIKLGSSVYIAVPANKRFQKMPDGTVVDMSGVYTAVDTGNLIKGHGGEYIGNSRTAGIDFYFGGPSYTGLCDSFGREKVSIKTNK